MSSSFGMFLGLDVGKRRPSRSRSRPDGKRLHDAPLPNTEPKLRGLFDKLAQHGLLLGVVHQPATIGALPVAVARAAGHQVAYLPGLAMRRIADLYPGRARPTPGTLSSSPTPPAPCPTPSARSTSATKPWPSSTC
jgi:hypothetical protein